MQISTLLVGWGWTFDQYRSGWLEVESLGYDACYIGDDLFPHPDFDQAVFDPWTMLPAMAVTTRRMKIGSLISPAGRRHPGLFAKITSNVDVMSNGRLILGMGSGNSPEQQASLHQPFLPAAERVAMLAEELTILHSMWTERRTYFNGKHYQVTDGILTPKPVAPEILLGFKSTKVMPAIAARFADRVNLLGAANEGIVAAIDALHLNCDKLQRDFGRIVKSRLASVILTDRPVDDPDRAIAAIAPAVGFPAQHLLDEHHGVVLSCVGSAEQVVESIERNLYKLGCDEIVICIETIDANSYVRTIQGLRRFAREVAPDLRRMRRMA